jgi:branched-chain amino acid transport system permease protein
VLQDRVAMLALLAVAFSGAAAHRAEYLFRAILIPFLILSLAALGLNILVGYCGQISLGTGASWRSAPMRPTTSRCASRHAADRVAAARRRARPASACCSASRRCASRGLYLAVATLAAQFFVDWAFLRISWFTNDSSSGSVSVAGPDVFGLPIESPVQKYLFCLAFVSVFALLAKNLVRGAIGREWMAIRDMDVAAAVIGIRPVYAKLTAFAVSSFIVGVAGALWGFVHLGSWELRLPRSNRSFQLLFMVIIGGPRSIMGSFFGAGLHRRPAPDHAQTSFRAGSALDSTARWRRTWNHDLRRADRFSS